MQTAVWIIAIAVAVNTFTNVCYVISRKMMEKGVMRSIKEDNTKFLCKLDEMEIELRKTLGKMYEDLEEIIKA